MKLFAFQVNSLLFLKQNRVIHTASVFPHPRMLTSHSQDIKPENLMLSRPNDLSRVTLVHLAHSATRIQQLLFAAGFWQRDRFRPDWLLPGRLRSLYTLLSCSRSELEVFTCFLISPCCLSWHQGVAGSAVLQLNRHVGARLRARRAVHEQAAV